MDHAGKLASRIFRSVRFGSGASASKHQRGGRTGEAAGTGAEAGGAGAAGSAGDGSLSEDSLDCPVCWEGLDAGNHAPYVLFCGHTLCRSCVLGLHWASVKLPAMQVHLPLLISCPWCQFLTLRLYWRGSIRFPSKNFFLLSLVETIRGSKLQQQEEPPPPPLFKLFDDTTNLSSFWQLGFSRQQRRDWSVVVDGFSDGTWSCSHVLLLLSLTVRTVAKLPLLCLLLFLLVYILPFSVLVLVLYCLVTVVVAVPAYLALYFAYPGMAWLMGEIAAT